MLVFFFSYVRISLQTAWYAVTLGSLCRDGFGAHYHPSLGALLAVCRVMRACTVCHAFMCVCNAIFFPKEKKLSVQIAWVQLWVWGREFKPSKLFYFFLLSPLSFKCLCFLLKYDMIRVSYVCIRRLNCMVHHNSAFPVQGRVRGIISSCWCRLSRVHVPCVMRDVSFF